MPGWLPTATRPRCRGCNKPLRVKVECGQNPADPDDFSHPVFVRFGYAGEGLFCNTKCGYRYGRAVALGAAAGPPTAGPDPADGTVVRYFHPREDVWEDHFRWSEDKPGELVGRTSTGRATVEALAERGQDFIADGAGTVGQRIDALMGAQNVQIARNFRQMGDVGGD